jgi:hypothetical protein
MRYRVVTTGLFEKKQLLVLQFEFEGSRMRILGGHLERYQSTWWEDATPEMITVTGGKVEEPC